MIKTWLLVVVAIAIAAHAQNGDVSTSLRVSEIMFSPRGSLQAEKWAGFKSTSDFEYIELVNRGSSPVDLTGVSLTGSVNYTFLSGLILGPSKYVVIAADLPAFVFRHGQINSTIPGAVLVGKFKGTPSKLSASGFSFTLRNFAGTSIQTVTYANWFKNANDRGLPIQVVNLAVDLFDQTNVCVGKFMGSPGSAGSCGGFVTFGVPNTTVLFTGSLSVPMALEAADGAGGSIVFTLDRSNPTGASTAYSTPVALTRSTQIRAAVKYSDGSLSPVFSRTFIYHDATLAQFEVKTHPITILETFGVDITPNDNIYKDFYMITMTPPPGVGTVSNAYIDSHSFGQIAVRGSSSSGNPKKSFAVKLSDDDNENRNVGFLGSPSDNTWVLYGPVKWDRTRGIRNYFVYKIMRDWFGNYAPRQIFTECLLNNGAGATLGSASYYGIEVLTEKISRGKDRVDVEALYPTDTTYPDVSGGYMIKMDRSAGNDTFQAPNGPQFVYVEPDPVDITPQMANYLTSWWGEFDFKLKSKPDPNSTISPYFKYLRYLNLKESIDNNILFWFSKIVDQYGYSTYLYKPRDPPNGTAPFSYGPPWDFDRAFGCDDQNNGWCDLSTVTQNMPQYNSTTYWVLMFNDPRFVKVFSDRYFELRNSVFTLPNIENIIRGIQANITSIVERDYALWKYGPTPGTTLNDEVNEILNWITLRLNWMDGLLCYNRAPDCVDNDYCTQEVCRSTDGKCFHAPLECLEPTCRYKSSDGSSCNGPDFCGVEGGVCTKGKCVGINRTCSDGVQCTIDRCDSLTSSCSNTPSDALCNDNFQCTTEYCDGGQGCIYTTDDAKCDDGIDCTEDRCVVGQGCVHTPIHTKCPDNISCTDDVCDVSKGCVHIPVNTSCQDNITCTVNWCDEFKGCLIDYPSSACSDSDRCTVDICDGTLGCLHAPDYSPSNCTNMSLSGCSLSPYLRCSLGSACDPHTGECYSCPTNSSANFEKTLCLSATINVECLSNTSAICGAPNLYCEPNVDRCAFCPPNYLNDFNHSECIPDANALIGSSPLSNIALYSIVAVGAFVILLAIAGLAFYFGYYRPRHRVSLFQNSLQMDSPSTSNPTGDYKIFNYSSSVTRY